ncbi:hypothetical protein [Streptococcus plurextorum]|uniref:hypothetical protein n=1 Tax=Streptococcus plurextorum TaxID=456876 RepID=UPI0003FED96C|nr:hypothetical protein [Streptococcus plurextorum]QBX10248.1 hypothetical protein JavanS421_0013 [Streptococcus satellite phage Javan421]
MTDKTDNKLLQMMENGFVLFLKNGIINYVEIPEHGAIKLKAQESKIVWKEVTTSNKV